MDQCRMRAWRDVSRIRRRFVSLLIASICVAFLSPGHAATGPAAESAYPTRPVRLVVPFAVGGSSDIIARMIGAKLTEAWSQPVVIDNRAGGGTIIGTDLVAKAAPDGYTILLGTNVNAVNETLVRKLPYDFARDFAPVTQLAASPNVLLVGPSIPVRSLRDFIAFAKARPGQLSYGSSGNGGTGHIAMEMLKSAADIDLVHIPYKGGGPALNALLGGEAPVLINSIIPAVPQIKAGRVVALGVTSSRRSSTLPNVPTIAEAGIPGFEAIGWFGFYVPAATPAGIVNRLNRQVTRILASPEISERLAVQGAEPVGNSPQELASFTRSEIAKWRKVIQGARIVPD
ncbi:MAG: tripartite tricarboxylate transporter substrate binding protein [Betaproteobacteria bacterium]|nr:tripartite tricarboxylate transporter substrate binding protein [Betaproteobacteria bacterium]